MEDDWMLDEHLVSLLYRRRSIYHSHHETWHERLSSGAPVSSLSNSANSRMFSDAQASKQTWFQ
jgi:hypothetical protein